MKSATFYATGKCNLRCKHCHVGNDQYNPRLELSTKEIDIVFTKLEIAGTKTLTLLGGEASIYRKDLVEIFESATSHNIKLSINTNLVSVALLEKILSSPALLNIVVSVDGASPETHNAVRGPGTFQYTIDNLRKLIEIKEREELKWDVDMTFVINKLNRKEGPLMVSLANELKIHKLNMKLLVPGGRAEDNLDILELTDEEIVDTLASILLKWEEKRSPKLDMYLPPAFVDYYNQKYDKNIPIEYDAACTGVSKFAYVDLNGNLLPCPSYSYEQKNLFSEDQRIEEISLLKRSAEEIMNTNLFSRFEQFRTSGHHKDKFIPCKFCKYNNICLPCTSEYQEGITNPIVQPCKAIYSKGDTNIVNSIFK